MRTRRSPSRFRAMSAILRHIGDEADAADGGRGQDADAVGLVVERDVAGDDGKSSARQASPMPSMRADELAHDLGPLGVAEVQVVGDGERLGADGA